MSMKRHLLPDPGCYTRLTHPGWNKLPLAGGFVVVALMCVANCQTGSCSPRERMPFNGDWRFVKGDPQGAEGELEYAALKPWLVLSGSEFSPGSTPKSKPPGNPGDKVVYTQAGYDDSGWRRLNLPHDWGIEGPFRQEYPGETGKLPWWGVGWYRKHFTVPAADQGKQFYLDVDGAMACASVWLNGQFVGGWPYG